MDRRGFVTTGVAAGLAGFTGAGGALGTLLNGRRSGSAGATMADAPIRLCFNENPLGLSPSARQAVIDNIVNANRYPTDYGPPLYQALAAHLGVKQENLVLSAGSTEILQVMTQAFQGPNVPMVMAHPTFEDIADYQDTQAFEMVQIPLTKDLTHDIGRMQEASKKRPSVIYICNPNNPTGTVTPCREIDAWIADAPATTTFVIDEAYYEYASTPDYWTSLKWIDTHPNVIVVRTFSKIFAMAGMRLGYSVSHPYTADRIREFVAQNQPNVLAGAAGVASLKDEGLIEKSVGVNEQSKKIAMDTLAELDLEAIPTQANFMMHRINGDLADYQNRMKERGLLVGRRFPPMDTWNRLSFGLPNEMDRWASALKDFRKKGWI